MVASFARVLAFLTLPFASALIFPACGGSAPETKSIRRAGCPKEMARVAATGGTGAAFCLDRTEVTVSAYAECIGRAACTAPAAGRDCNQDTPGTQTQPINCVDWAQANAYCQSQSKRLPSEEEWEAAASTQEPGGDVCWSGSRPLPGTCAVDRPGAQVTPQGVVDLSGNVGEWTSGGTTAARAIRGGFWSASDPSSLHPEARRSARSVDRSSAVGFRCAADM